MNLFIYYLIAYVFPFYKLNCFLMSSEFASSQEYRDY